MSNPKRETHSDKVIKKLPSCTVKKNPTKTVFFLFPKCFSMLFRRATIIKKPYFYLLLNFEFFHKIFTCFFFFKSLLFLKFLPMKPSLPPSYHFDKGEYVGLFFVTFYS